MDYNNVYKKYQYTFQNAIFLPQIITTLKINTGKFTYVTSPSKKTITQSTKMFLSI